MTGQPTTTVTVGPGPGPIEGASRPAPQLFLLVDADRPRDGSERHLLDDVDEVVIGRGRARAAERVEHRGLRRLLVRAPDRRVSQQHARLLRARNRWVLEDLGSKNGTRLGGVELGERRTLLADGDVIECGHLVLLYREAPVAPAVELPVRELQTFCAPLAHGLLGLAKIAPAAIPVILLGETGTGKEVVARAAHLLSGRSGPFVAVNCGALPESLREAELFGHRKGAFSGAVEDRPGIVRSAHRGTLLLDEIGELSPAAQSALLRVLQEQEVVPLGEARPVKVDVRLMAATHRDLAALVDGGQFRRDLHARMAGLTLQLPPLRERREDLGLLIAALLARSPDGRRAALTPAAVRALVRHDWPANVRELEQCLAVAAALAGEQPIDLAHLPEAVRRGPAGADPALSDDQRRHRDDFIALLTRHQGNVAAVARALGKGRMQIHRWARRYGLDLEAFRR